ncbi:MAG TPA: hypothetical protein PLN58_06380, partial [Bacilli bacterium]|nr:hypothetical protein [Bacilli bacterium]
IQHNWINGVFVFLLVANVLWYGVVRDYEAISYQFTPTFFTSRKRPKTSEIRMHYTMCYGQIIVCLSSI